MVKDIEIVRCGSCGKVAAFDVDRGPEWADELEHVAGEAGWRRPDRPLVITSTDWPGVLWCPPCNKQLRAELATAAAAAAAEPPPVLLRLPARRGLTLIELLVVLAIVSIIAYVVLPMVLDLSGGGRLYAGADLLRGALVSSRAKAEAARSFAGVRLLPDPATIKRRADGSIDPTSPLIYDRFQTMAAVPGLVEGRASIKPPADPWPGAFAPPAGRLVLEQAKAYDDGGVRIPYPPTIWAWNVRVGDQVKVGAGFYTVCGPMALGFDRNPEGFVNYDPAWPALDRGDGPCEWLLLTNNRDDDGDGRVDNGWNGIDDDLDGVVDGVSEWTEIERWLTPIPAEGVVATSYAVLRRPAPDATRPTPFAGVVVDASGWGDSDPARSRLPIDPWTGAVDLVVDAGGGVQPARYHGQPSAFRWFHLWFARREDVAYPPSSAEGEAMLLSIDARNGRVSIVDADPADPAAARGEAEGRSR